MSGRGRRVSFHGAFKSKAKAQAKERRTAGAFIREYRMHGRTRYVVMTERRR